MNINPKLELTPPSVGRIKAKKQVRSQHIKYSPLPFSPYITDQISVHRLQTAKNRFLRKHPIWPQFGYLELF